MSSDQRPAPDAEAPLADTDASHPAAQSSHEQQGGLSQKRKASTRSQSPDDGVSTKKPRLGDDGVGENHSESPSKRPTGATTEASRGGDAGGAGPDARPDAADEPSEQPQSRDDEPRPGPTRRRTSELSPAQRRDRSRDRHRDRDRDRDPGRERDRERERRRDFSLEEKKRGQRLFGGLLSTLSQKTGGAQQKRRQDIERRQRERDLQRRAENDRRRAELLAVRKRAQIQFDEQAMRTRHSNMLSLANSLKTRSSPPIYYRPWEMTREQEDTINEQVREAEAAVAREVNEFERSKQQRLADLGVASHQPRERDSTVGERHTEAPEASHAVTTNRPPSQHGLDKDHDEEMVETEEGTLIY